MRTPRPQRLYVPGLSVALHITTRCLCQSMMNYLSIDIYFRERTQACTDAACNHCCACYLPPSSSITLQRHIVADLNEAVHGCACSGFRVHGVLELHPMCIQQNANLTCTLVQVPNQELGQKFMGFSQQRMGNRHCTPASLSVLNVATRKRNMCLRYSSLVRQSSKESNH